MPKQTDNSNLPAKLYLRRYFLDKYHASTGSATVSAGSTTGKATDADVFDACQGDGAIWRTLRKEGYQLASYWGVDEKAKKGRLKIDSVKVLGQPGWEMNVIDIDTYGSPWKHWLAMLPHAVCAWARKN